MRYEKPNLVLPLAASFNTRGTDGYTNVVAGKDQVKINSVYDVVNNSLTGSTKVYLRKRPGFIASSITGGSSSHAPWLALETPSGTNSTGVILDDGTDIKVYYDATNATIRNNDADPQYCDTTVISGANRSVVQFTDGTAYYTTGGNFAVWAQISDADFTGITPTGKMEHMDGYAFQMGAGNKIYNSDLNSVSAWTAANFITKSILQDEPLGLARLGRIILAFGKETVEGFYNAGNATGSPLSRINTMATRIGLKNTLSTCRHYATAVGNVLYFIGCESKGYGTSSGIYAFDGSAFKKVSNGAIDKILAEGGAFNRITHIGPYPIYGSGIQVAVCLTNVEATTQRWLVYWPALNDWTLHTSTTTQPVNDSNAFIGIAAVTGDKRYSFSESEGYQDGGAAYTMTHQFKLPSSGHNIKRMPYVGVIGDTQTSASDLSISFSDDDYQTFSTARTIDMTKVKKQIYRCGAYRDRAVKLEHSANTDCRLEAFIARVEE